MNKLVIIIILMAVFTAGIAGFLAFKPKRLPIPAIKDIITPQQEDAGLKKPASQDFKKEADTDINKEPDVDVKKLDIGKPDPKEPEPISKKGFLSKEVNFKADDGKKVIGYLSKPEGSRKFPAIILVHGGTSSKTATRNLGSQKHAQVLTDNGYITLSVDYRESEFGGKEIDDVIAGINYLKTLNFADSNKIGLFGSSHGAYMSLMTASREGKGVKAIVENFGFTDLAEQYNRLVSGETSHSEEDVQGFIKMGDTYFGGSPDESPEEYEKRSPVYNVKNITAPVLIIHGKEDKSVPVGQAYALRDALKEAGKIYEIKIYTNGPHGFIYKNTPEAKDAGKNALRFFDKYLK